VRLNILFSEPSKHPKGSLCVNIRYIIQLDPDRHSRSLGRSRQQPAVSSSCPHKTRKELDFSNCAEGARGWMLSLPTDADKILQRIRA
jgi:hypothetical protein